MGHPTKLRTPCFSRSVAWFANPINRNRLSPSDGAFRKRRSFAPLGSLGMKEKRSFFRTRIWIMPAFKATLAELVRCETADKVLRLRDYFLYLVQCIWKQFEAGHVLPLVPSARVNRIVNSIISVWCVSVSPLVSKNCRYQLLSIADRIRFSFAECYFCMFLAQFYFSWAISLNQCFRSFAHNVGRKMHSSQTLLYSLDETKKKGCIV